MQDVDFLGDQCNAERPVPMEPQEILSEYKGVLSSLGVRRILVGKIVNLLREDAVIRSENNLSPDPDNNAFCASAEQGRAAFIVTLNKKHFPDWNLTAEVISPGDPIPTTRQACSSGASDEVAGSRRPCTSCVRVWVFLVQSGILDH
jgi:hypothetical protein